MSYVIAEPCIGTKDNSCVEVCPVDCIHPTPDEPDYESAEMLFIDPDECIDCAACVPECPVEAIYDETQLPAELAHWAEINAEKSLKLPVLAQREDALPTAEARRKELGF